jgi:hypothetical protein
MDSTAGAITVFAILLPRSNFDYTSPLALAAIILGTVGMVLALVAIVRSSRFADLEAPVGERKRSSYGPDPALSASNHLSVAVEETHHGHV